MKTILALLLCTAAASAQMPQTITSYGNNSWPQTTTIAPNGSGGYNYSRVGNGGSVWGGVTAAPGTTVSAAVTPRGEIVPIVTPKDDPLLEMATISAPAYDLPPMPPIPRRAPTATTKESNKEIPPPANYSTNAYGQYAWLHNQLNRDSMKQLAIDWKRDTGLDKNARIDTHALLGYLRLWVRSHPGCLSGRVIGSDAQKPSQ